MVFGKKKPVVDDMVVHQEDLPPIPPQQAQAQQSVQPQVQIVNYEDIKINQMAQIIQQNSEIIQLLQAIYEGTK